MSDDTDGRHRLVSLKKPLRVVFEYEDGVRVVLPPTPKFSQDVYCVNEIEFEDLVRKDLLCGGKCGS